LISDDGVEHKEKDGVGVEVYKEAIVASAFSLWIRMPLSIFSDR